MTDYAPQVDKSHYGAKYRGRDRWLSYFYQLALVRSVAPKSALEIGPGEGIVTATLRKDGVRVVTCDIAEDLQPDVVGSVVALPFKDEEFELSIAAEVLEHIRFEDVPQALKELRRVSSKYVVVSLPHPGWVFSLSFKLPLLPYLSLFFQIPFFWQEHKFNGEHYWELGKRGYPASRFAAAAQAAGLELVRAQKHIDDPVHRLFIFSKNADVAK
jgi:ubiquinone/menaquinone biosynthesis C-methylase UbiE